MCELVEAKVEHRFSRAIAEEVYDAWLKENDVRLWMNHALTICAGSDGLRTVEIDARVGGRFRFTDMRNGEEAMSWGVYHILERPRVIEFTWFATEEDEREGSSIVRIHLEPMETGCKATLTHSMSAAYAEYLDITKKAWSGMLSSIDALKNGELANT